jgi:outer membrane biosynthesis protein TonB
MSKEQQPIDKLFARKLEGLEGTPSPQAWNRLESRLGQKKTSKKGMIWLSYAAAAAVVLLLGALWVIFSRETPRPKPDIAVREGIKQNPALRTVPPATSETPNPAASASGTGTLAQTPAAEPKQEREIPATEIVPAPEKTERLATAEPSRERKPAIKSIPEVQPVRRPEAPAPRPAPEEQFARNTVKPVPVDQLPTPEEQTLVVVVQLPAENTTPKAAFAEETFTDAEEPAETEAAPRTRTGRLLEGLKKAKRGEFRELGLTPDHLLARFREKGEKADVDSRD